MSGKKEKALRRSGQVISIDARRRNRDFERVVREYPEVIAMRRGQRSDARRIVLAVAALALIAASIAWALGF